MRKAHRNSHVEKGSSLIEMMIAMLVLTVGLVGTIALVTTAITSNGRSRHDSTSAALAEMVAGQISAVPFCSGGCGGGVASVTITDCAGNVLTVDTTGSTAGNGATLNSSGNVDYVNQTFAGVPAGYGMKYTVCGTSNGINMVYDIRWNIKQVAANSAEEFVVVGAQPVIAKPTTNARAWAAPVNVRTLVGNDGN